MPNVDEVYAGSNMNAAYVKEHLDGKSLMISAVTIKTFGDEGEDKERKAVLHFKGEKKSLSLNKTNKNIIRDAWGPDTDAWVNRHIILRVIRTAYMGEPCDGVQVDCVQSVTPATPTNATTTATIDLPMGAKAAATLTGKIAELAAKEPSNNFEAMRTILAANFPAKAEIIKGPPERWPRSLVPSIQAWVKAAEENDEIPF